MMQEVPQSVPFAPMTNCYGPSGRPILWLIPALPILAAGVIALLKQPASQDRRGSVYWLA